MYIIFTCISTNGISTFRHLGHFFDFEKNPHRSWRQALIGIGQRSDGDMETLTGLEGAGGLRHGQIDGIDMATWHRHDINMVLYLPTSG